MGLSEFKRKPKEEIIVIFDVNKTEWGVNQRMGFRFAKEMAQFFLTQFIVFDQGKQNQGL